MARELEAGLVRLAPLLVAAILALEAGWLLAPALPWCNIAAIGQPGSDVLRAVWGFDFLRRSALPPDLPFWSGQAGAPAGVLALILPTASGTLLGPLGAALGPVGGYNAAIFLLLWAAGLAAAGLARVLTGRWSVGLALGSAWMAQPMLLHAVTDGTAEHVAVWAMPAALAALCLALREGGARWGALAGASLVWVALDSPYLAVYTAFVLLFVLPALWPRRGPARAALPHTLRGLAMVTVPAALGLALLYRQFPAAAGQQDLAALQALNATDLDTWTAVLEGRAGGPAPTMIPTALLCGGLTLSLLGGRRVLPWLGAGIFALGLSFGRREGLAEDLAGRFGAIGAIFEYLTKWLNNVLLLLPGVGSVRFPERWLVPAALLIGLAGAVGLARILDRVRAGALLSGGLGLVMALALFSEGVGDSGFRAAFPLAVVPDFAFTAWLRDQPERGAYLLLPDVRPAAPAGQGTRPVFASLTQDLVPSDAEAIAARVGRATVGAPGLQTLTRRPQDPRIQRTLEDWDDLAHPRLTGNAIPPGADDPRADRVRGEAIALLVEGGLRWIVVDLGAYEGIGLDALRRQLGSRIREEKRFDEGDGVLIFKIE